MGTGRKTQIRIIKQGNITGSQAKPLSRERPKKDPMAELICGVTGWVAEFEERRRPDPRITFQTLFKEV
jgi:hypothetical protein